MKESSCFKGEPIQREQLLLFCAFWHMYITLAMRQRKRNQSPVYLPQSDRSPAKHNAKHKNTSFDLCILSYKIYTQKKRQLTTASFNRNQTNAKIWTIQSKKAHTNLEVHGKGLLLVRVFKSRLNFAALRDRLTDMCFHQEVVNMPGKKTGQARSLFGQD